MIFGDILCVELKHGLEEGEASIQEAEAALEGVIKNREDGWVLLGVQ